MLIVEPEGNQVRSPLVSFIILNINEPEMTAEAVDAIKKQTTIDNFEVIVVDNGSTDDAFQDWLAFGVEATTVRLGSNVYFGEGNNLGADIARGEILVFLNNDTAAQSGWLEPLLRAINRPLVGAVGPVFQDAKGAVLEAGARIDEKGKVQAAYRGSTLDTVRGEEHEVDFVSAACLMMRRNLFLQIGGFDCSFLPAYFEDADLCRRLRTLSKRTIVCPASAVIHRENVTSHKLFSTVFLSLVKRTNRQTYLRNRDVQNGSLIAPGFETAFNQKFRHPAPDLTILFPEGVNLDLTSILSLRVSSELESKGVATSLSVLERVSQSRIAQMASFADAISCSLSSKSLDETDSSKAVIRITASKSSWQGMSIELLRPQASTVGQPLIDRLRECAAKSIPNPQSTQEWETNSGLGVSTLLQTSQRISFLTIVTVATMVLLSPIFLSRGRGNKLTFVGRPTVSTKSRLMFLTLGFFDSLGMVRVLNSPSWSSDGEPDEDTVLVTRSFEKAVVDAFPLSGETERQTERPLFRLARRLLSRVGLSLVQTPHTLHPEVSVKSLAVIQQLCQEIMRASGK